MKIQVYSDRWFKVLYCRAYRRTLFFRLLITDPFESSSEVKRAFSLESLVKMKGLIKYHLKKPVPRITWLIFCDMVDISGRGARCIDAAEECRILRLPTHEG